MLPRTRQWVRLLQIRKQILRLNWKSIEAKHPLVMLIAKSWYCSLHPWTLSITDKIYRCFSIQVRQFLMRCLPNPRQRMRSRQWGKFLHGDKKLQDHWPIKNPLNLPLDPLNHGMWQQSLYQECSRPVLPTGRQGVQLCLQWKVRFTRRLTYLQKHPCWLPSVSAQSGMFGMRRRHIHAFRRQKLRVLPISRLWMRYSLWRKILWR